MKKTVLLVGGGTMGSVSPLLAVVPELRERGYTVEFIGTSTGPERAVIEGKGIPFTPIVSWKFRRYLTWRHVLMPFEAVAANWQSFWYLLRYRPAVIVSTGGFVATPVIWMGYILGIPSVVHQQDIRPGLANVLVRFVATTFTVAFEESLKHFPKKNTQWIGNPVRDLTPSTSVFELDSHVPTVFVVGGGTGARDLNALITQELCMVANVIHGTGGRTEAMQRIDHPRYHAQDFFDKEYAEALHVADVVVSRAGLGSITELAVLGKKSILIPLPGTHQEENAKFLESVGAARFIDQRTTSAQELQDAILELYTSGEHYTHAIRGVFPANANTTFVDTIESVVTS